MTKSCNCLTEMVTQKFQNAFGTVKQKRTCLQRHEQVILLDNRNEPKICEDKTKKVMFMGACR